MNATELESRRTAIRPVTADDFEDLARIRSLPAVARWWQARTAAEVEQEWEQAQTDGEAHWTIWVEGERRGFIQAYEETDPDYHHAGIDLYLDPALHGQRFGREVTERVARHLFDDIGHHRVIIDPTLANTAAVKCYEAVGFTPVGVMRQYWFDHVEQRWADALLMDLMRDDPRRAE